MPKSKRRTPRDPLTMRPEERAGLHAECQRKLELMESFFASAEEWKILAQYLEGRLRRLENEGKGQRRRLGRPVMGQPAITLEQIAAHEARIDENGIIRRLDKTILALWREQIAQLQTIRASSA